MVIAGGLVAAMFSRFAGLLLYLWFAFFRPQEFAWNELDAFRPSLVAGVVFVGPSLLTGIMPNVTHPLSLGMIGFFLTAVVAQFGAYQWDAGLEGLDQLGRIVIVSLLAVTLLSTRERLLTALAVVVMSLGFHGAKVGVSFIAHGGAQITPAIGGMFSDNNDFALAISRIVVPCFALGLLLQGRWLRTGFLFASPIVALGVMASYSRGGFLALASSVLVYLMLSRRRALAMVLVVLGLSVVPLAQFLPEAYVARLSTITAEGDERDSSTQGRLHYWHVARMIAVANPLGVGLKNYPHAYDTYDDSGGLYGEHRAVHSTHFEVLSETGFLGFALWSGLNLYAVFLLWRIRRRATRVPAPPEVTKFYFVICNVLLAALAAFLVGGSFLAQTLNELNWVTYAFVAALHRLSLKDLPAPVAAPVPAPAAAMPSPVAAHR